MKKFISMMAVVLIGLPGVMKGQESGSGSTGGGAGGEAAKTPDMTSERPSHTETSSIVPFGHVQFEAGTGLRVNETDSARHTTYVLPGLLVRVGLSDAVELRVGGEFEAVHQEALAVRDLAEGNEARTYDSTGVGDIILGGKVRLMNDEGMSPEIAVSSHLSLPVGAFGPENVEFHDARISTSKSFLDMLTVGANVGAARNSDREVKGIYGAVVGLSALGVVGIYAEAFGEAPWDSNAAHSVGGGLSWSLIPNVQVDVSGGKGLTEAADEYYLNAGLSVRVP